MLLEASQRQETLYRRLLENQGLGLQGRAIVSGGKGLKVVRLSPLQIAEIAASECGFFDLDVKPTGIGSKVEIEARSRHKATVRVTGANETEAVRKMLEVFGWE